eukprot:5270070-Amphidinium_carterae.1
MYRGSIDLIGCHAQCLQSCPMRLRVLAQLIAYVYPKVEVVLPIAALLTWDHVCVQARTIALAEKSVYSACMRN